MAERFRLKVGVTRLNTCLDCPIARVDFPQENSDHCVLVCRIGESERELGHVPTYKEIENKHHIAGTVYWFRIPDNCPNEYRNPDTLPVSARKK